MPPTEVDVDEDLVRRLLESQFPQWAALPLAPVDAIGWDNLLYRLGDELVVRLPRRQLAVGLMENEHRWLPSLAATLPVPIPVPLGKGRPGHGYPWPWSVCPWIPGQMAVTAALAGDQLRTVAAELGAFVAALRRPAPADGPRTGWRGVPLSARDDLTRSFTAALGDAVDREAVIAAWEDVLAVPHWSAPDVWVHGDLHPANLLVDARHLSGVIDWGDIVVGDPSTDLVSGWMLFGPDERDVFRGAAGVDAATWDRGRGWALSIGLGMLANSSDNPVINGIGRRAVDEVLRECAV